MQRSQELSGSVRPVPLSEYRTVENNLVYPPDVNPIRDAAAPSPSRLKSA